MFAPSIRFFFYKYAKKGKGSRLHPFFRMFRGLEARGWSKQYERKSNEVEDSEKQAGCG
jgi:hypothetical protein